MMSNKITLASASPRRRELLEQIGVDYDVLAVDIDESHQAGEQDEVYVQRLALQKAQAGFKKQRTEQPVLGSDTIVVLNNRILGKPASKNDGIEMLSALSGHSHQVMTAVAMVSSEQNMCLLSTSRVSFRVLSPQEIQAYWDTGEPADKAGGYGIQGLAAQFIQHLEGSYSGVMGLPLFETAQLMEKFSIRLLDK